MFKNLFLLCIGHLIVIGAWAQNINRQVLHNMVAIHQRKTILTPDIEGFITLKCDFHMHTVFSDGMVSPETRVQEAWNDGLDVIAITDHEVNHPFENYMAVGGKSFKEMASEALREKGIIMVSGMELSRDMPPGHLNALFLEDYSIPELYDTAREATSIALKKLKEQGAVIIWNHPGWAAQQKDTVRWFDYHTEIWERGYLDGIEVFNYNEWYPVALQWAMNRNLAPFANSDAHAPLKLTYYFTGDFIRPMTLVFATGRNEQAVREAILARRTAAWFDGILAGHENLLTKLLARSVKIEKQAANGGKTRYLLTNLSDFPIFMKGWNDNQEHTIELLPRNTTDLIVPDGCRSVDFRVTNWMTGMQSNLQYLMELPASSG